MRTGSKLLQAAAYCALVLWLAGNLYVEHSGRFVVRVPQKFVMATGFMLFWSLATFCGAPIQNGQARQTRLRRYFLGLFFYYIWILGNMLFFDAAFGRTPSAIAPHVRAYQPRMNLEPFRMIRDYLRAYQNGNIRGSIVAINLLGNAVAFAPMGFFLPTLCRPMRNFFLFTLATGAMICAVELTQYYTGAGSCDIDDLILNLAGALIIWLFVQLPPIRRRAYAAKPSLQKRSEAS